MPGVHPRAEEGVVERSACFSGKQLCCMESASMLVRNCGGFYVYKLDSMPSFNYSFRFCGAGVEGNVRCPTKRKALDSCFFLLHTHE